MTKEKQITVGTRVYVDEGDSLGAVEYSGFVSEVRDDGTYLVHTVSATREFDPEQVAYWEVYQGPTGSRGIGR